MIIQDEFGNLVVVRGKNKIVYNSEEDVLETI